MPVMIRITSKGNVETVLQIDQASHGVGGRWVHANFAIPVNRHETECWIDHFVFHNKIQPETVCYCRPVMNSGAAKRIDPDANVRVPYHIHINHTGQIIHVIVEEVVLMRCRRAQCVFETDPFYTREFVLE